MAGVSDCGREEQAMKKEWAALAAAAFLTAGVSMAGAQEAGGGPAGGDTSGGGAKTAPDSGTAEAPHGSGSGRTSAPPALGTTGGSSGSGLDSGVGSGRGSTGMRGGR
jgi:hypothetical protein